MRCPGCAASVDFSKDSCPKCDTAYLKAFEERAVRSGRPVPVRTPPQWPLIAAALALAAAVVLTFSRGSSANLAGDLLVSPRLGLAFAPPSGWALEPRAEGLRWTSGPAGLLLSSRPGSDARSAQGLFNGSDLRFGEPQPARLAGREALRWRVTGERTVLPGASQTVDWEGWVVAFEEGGRVYSMSAWSERGDFSRRSAELEAVLSSVVLTSN